MYASTGSIGSCLVVAVCSANDASVDGDAHELLEGCLLTLHHGGSHSSNIGPAPNAEWSESRDVWDDGRLVVGDWA